MRKPSLAILSEALSVEWRIAVGRLTEKERLQMKCPTFIVTKDLPGKWGQWRGGKAQCIELREELILRHPWYAVVDVLRHETAHQAVELLYPAIVEPPHGPCFLKLCTRLGARPQASGDYPTLDEVVYRDDSAEDSAARNEGAVTPQARLLLKIRKLLSLSGSANENEARAALLKARELEAKFAEEFGNESTDGTDGASESPDDRLYAIGIGPLVRRVTIQDMTIGQILQEFYRVRVLWDCCPNLDATAPNAPFLRQLNISGSRKDLRIAVYVYECLTAYLRHAVYELPTPLLGKVLSSVRMRRELEMGILDGFREALREQNQRPEMRALVLGDATKLNEYHRWLYPNVRKATHSFTSYSPEMRAAGETLGRSFQVKPALEKGNRESANNRTKPRTLPE